MKRKRAHVLLAAFLIATLLLACGGQEQQKKQGEEETSRIWEEEPVELKMILYSLGHQADDTELVEAAISDYIEPKIGARLSIEWINVGDWSSQINLKLSRGEQVDLLSAFGDELSSLYGKNMLTNMNDLIDTYGADIQEVIGEDYLQAGCIDGNLYSVPTMQFWGKNQTFLYRKDIAEKYNLDFSSVKSLEDLAPILKIVQEKEPEMSGIVGQGPAYTLLESFGWDTLGDEYGVLMDPLYSLEVTNLFETEQYRSLVETMHDFYEKGYVQQDAATNLDDIPTLFRTGNAFGSFGSTDPTTLANSVRSFGYEIGYVVFSEPMVTTTTVNSGTWSIPKTSADPQKAMEFINLLYHDPTVVNLLVYGIEGVHYQVVDRDQGVIRYLDGQDISTCRYNGISASLAGNRRIAYIRDTEPITLISDMDENRESANISLAMGFVFDSSGVANELNALNTVASKYWRALECGALDPETELDHFLQELKEAGIDKVVEEKNRQLAFWAEKMKMEE